MVVSVVDAPHVRGESALRPKNIFLRVESLIHFEFKCLRCTRVLDVVIKVVNKICRRRARGYRIPPICIGVVIGASQEKLHRDALQDWRSNALFKPMVSKCALAGCPGTLAARVPA